MPMPQPTATDPPEGSATPPFAAKPLPGGSFGAEIAAADLSERPDDAFRAAALDALHRYEVLVFRDQSLTDTQYREFALGFGPLEPRISRYDRGETYQDLHRMTNVAADGSLSAGHQDAANRHWHTDKAYKARPSLATILYAIDVPEAGGETEFCNLTAAYRDLSPAMCDRISGLRVRHHWSHAYDGKPDFRKATSDEETLNPPVFHPLVRTHPATGEKALYLGYFAADIVGMPVSEGRALLDELTAHATQRKYVLVHRWRRGDVVMWDNRCLLHRGRPYDHNTQPRTLIRAVVQGDVPV
jgi:alpha-ketoglutarate-dependent taurine dioxygenase